MACFDRSIIDRPPTSQGGGGISDSTLVGSGEKKMYREQKGLKTSSVSTNNGPGMVFDCSPAHTTTSPSLLELSSFFWIREATV